MAIMIYSDENTPDIIFLNVVVKPGSKENRFISGIDELVVYLKSSPVKGKANKELLSFLSTILNIKKTQIKIVKGIKNRNKIIELQNITKEVAESSLDLKSYDFK